MAQWSQRTKENKAELSMRYRQRNSQPTLESKECLQQNTTEERERERSAGTNEITIQDCSIDLSGVELSVKEQIIKLKDS